MAGEKTQEEEALAVKLLEDIASKDKDDAPDDEDPEEGSPEPEGEGDQGEEAPPDPDEAPDDEEDEPNEGTPPQDNTPSTIVGKGIKLANENDPVDVELSDLIQGISTIVSKALEVNTPLIVKAVSDAVTAQIDTKVSEAVSKALTQTAIGEGENLTSIAKALAVIAGRTSTIKKGITDLDAKVEAGNSASDSIAKALPSLAGSAEKADAVTKALQNLARTTPAVSEGANSGNVVEKGVVAPMGDTSGETGITEADGKRLSDAITKARAIQDQTGKGVSALTNVLHAANNGKITKAMINEFVIAVDTISK